MAMGMEPREQLAIDPPHHVPLAGAFILWLSSGQFNLGLADGGWRLSFRADNGRIAGLSGCANRMVFHSDYCVGTLTTEEIGFKT